MSFFYHWFGDVTTELREEISNGAEILSLRKQVASITKALDTKTKILQTTQELVKEQQERLGVVEKEKESLEDKIAEQNKEIAELKLKLEAVADDKEKVLLELVEKYEAKSEYYQALVNRKSDEITSLRTTITKLSDRLDVKQKKTVTLEKMMCEQDNTINELQSEKEELLAENYQVEEEKHELNQELIEERSRRMELEQSIDDDVKQYSNEMKRLLKELKQSKTELNAIKKKLAGYSKQMAELNQRMLENNEGDVSALEEKIKDMSIDAELLKDKVAALEKAILKAEQQARELQSMLNTNGLNVEEQLANSVAKVADLVAHHTELEVEVNTLKEKNDEIMRYLVFLNKRLKSVTKQQSVIVKTRTIHKTVKTHTQQANKEVQDYLTRNAEDLKKLQELLENADKQIQKTITLQKSAPYKKKPINGAAQLAQEKAVVASD
mmetsp:Transcript_18602/g.20691  ORF Transcript_18602/g.20691 Transcript_18602/m.20691 type:complete len:440 (+) Transcript_18602:59-1378(+)